MDEHEDLLRKSYDAYNTRDLSTLVLALAPDVEWPDRLEGVTLHGVEAVSAYWERQWEAMNPVVEFMHFEWDRNGNGVATLLEIIRGPNGAIISKGPVRHVYQFENGLVKSMQVHF